MLAVVFCCYEYGVVNFEVSIPYKKENNLDPAKKLA